MLHILLLFPHPPIDQGRLCGQGGRPISVKRRGTQLLPLTALTRTKSGKDAGDEVRRRKVGQIENPA